MASLNGDSSHSGFRLPGTTVVTPLAVKRPGELARSEILGHGDGEDAPLPRGQEMTSAGPGPARPARSGYPARLGYPDSCFRFRL